MSNFFKKLVGETAVYGLSSIVGRLLNWLLVPLYTRIFLPEEYGVVSNLLAYVAFLMVFLMYGMETGFFRFSSKKDDDKVYSTVLISLFFTSSLFILITVFFANSIQGLFSYDFPAKYIWWLGVTVSVDAFLSIPFARLRQQNKSWKFAGFKLINIGVNIGLNLFFLVLCKWLYEINPNGWVSYIYKPSVGVGYIFISYLAASLVTLLLFTRELLTIKWHFNFILLRRIVGYSLPILLVGLANMVNLNIDKILLVKLIPEKLNPVYQLGVYSANFKIGVLMTLFVQAFRFSFEPFFFSLGKSKDSIKVYADVLKYFVIFVLLVFLGVCFNLGIIKYFIDENYHSGLKIVPVVLLGDMFFGIFSILSLWYKLSNRTIFGAYLAVGGAFITIMLNFVLVPYIGYIGAAWASLSCFVSMTIASYILGQRFFPVPYNLSRILFYFGVALGLFGFYHFYVGSNFVVGNLLLLGFVSVVLVREKGVKELKSFILR